MSKRDSFIFYRSFFEAINDMPVKHQLKVYKAICSKSLNFAEVELKGISNTIFTLIKPQLEANNRRFINGSKGAEHGIKGGRPVTPTETPKEPLANPKKTPNSNVNDNVNVNVKETKKERPNKFVRPVHDDLKRFFKEKGLTEGAAAEKSTDFINYYDSNGWKVGRSAMKDWEAAARGVWMKEKNNNQHVTPVNNAKNADLDEPF